MLADDLLHNRPSNWSDLALNQDSKAGVRPDRPRGTLLVWGYRPDVFAYTRMPAGSRFLDSQPLTGVLADRHLTSSQPFAPEWAARNRRELIASDPTWIVDGLGPLNPALAITNFRGLARMARELSRSGPHALLDHLQVEVALAAYSPLQHATRFSRNAEMPSCASCASEFMVITSLA